MMASQGSAGRARPGGFVLARPLVLLSMLVGGLFSASLFVLARALNQREDERRLERDGRACVAALHFGIEAQLSALEVLGGLWLASEVVTREEFHGFAEPLLERYPALNWLGWSPLMTKSQIVELVRAEREAGSADFRLQTNGDVAPERTGEPRLYYPVRYAVPDDVRAQVLGLDLGSDPQRTELLRSCAAKRAMGVGAPERLLQEQPGHGLLATLPVQLEPGAGALVPGRDGFVVGELSLERAIRQAVGRLQDEGIDLTLVVRGKAGPVLSLYLPAPGSPAAPDPSTLADVAGRAEEFDLAGSTWQVVWRPGTAYQHAGLAGFPWLLLGVGLLLTAALTSLLAQRELRASGLERAHRELAATSSALRKSEERFRLLFERHGTTMILVDGETSGIVDANPAAARFYGYSREQMRRMRVSDLNTLPSDRVRDLLDAATAESRDCFVVPHRLASGQERTVEIHSSPIEYQGRRLLFAIVHDISEREAMQRKLLETQKLESLGVLAGGIAHDFNNLLTSVMGNAELARQQLGQGSPARRHMDLCIRAVGRAADLTRRLLAYAGKGSYERQRLDLAEQVREVVDLLRPGVISGLRIELELQADMPPLSVDRTQLHQVLMNLLLNAVEACDPAAGRVLLRTARVDEVPVAAGAQQGPPGEAFGPHALIEVVDNGAGMDEATLGRIFDPFFSTKFTGRGLGLAAVQGIVRSHGGLLAVDSRPGNGARFRVWLPLDVAPVLPAARDGAPTAGARLLVVDDDATVREVSASMLEALGFEAAVAESGERALELVRRARPGVRPGDPRRHHAGAGRRGDPAPAARAQPGSACAPDLGLRRAPGPAPGRGPARCGLPAEALLAAGPGRAGAFPAGRAPRGYRWGPQRVGWKRGA